MKHILIMTAAMAACSLTACGGGSSNNTPPPLSSSPPTPPATPPTTPVSSTSQTMLKTQEAARDFLMRASWGGSQEEIESLVDTDAADWISAQLSLPMTEIVPIMQAGTETQQFNLKVWWDQALNNDDVLRARMVFALSQIVVCSNTGRPDTPSARRMGAYQDTLGRHAFGNYRDLLEEVTYNGQMAVFLTYLGNRKASDDGLQQPDENYAREIMQLFSIGLVELNMDGTVRLGADGVPIETYNNDDIVGLARVFTGLDYDPDLTNTEQDYNPLTVDPRFHSDEEKSFLGTTISAGTDGPTSISMAIDAIFAHPNVAPFVASRLIQRFTQSTPTPDYVERVATAFENGSFVTQSGERFGTGERGNLAATLAAVLLDPQFFDDTPPLLTEGKVREPILKFTQWAKAMEVETLEASNESGVFSFMNSTTRGLSQGAFQSPSVFNFYRTGFQAPGSASGEAGLIAPELQLVNEGQLRAYNDYMFNFVVDSTTRVNTDIDSFRARYPVLTEMADDPAAMVDYLDNLLISGTFEPVTRQRMIDAITLSPLRDDELEEDKFNRAKIAVYMAVTSSEYGVQY